MSPSARRKARKLLLQALYQWQQSGVPLNEIEAWFLTKHITKKTDVEYFSTLLHMIPAKLDLIDAQYKPFLDRDIEALNPVELTALRIGVYELLERLDIPYKVAINEALELTKTFGSVEGHKYVNGVLDKVAKKLRVAERGKN